MGRQAPLDPTAARAPVFAPTSGPVGTTVTVLAGDLPALTPIYLGLGATRSSFEVLSELVTSEAGEMKATVTVPEWATVDRAHYFVLVDVYFRPVAVSGAFHVTTENGLITRRGQITDEGVDCLALREDGDRGELYTLLGDVDRMVPGDAVLVTGSLREGSACQQGTTLSVTRITH